MRDFIRAFILLLILVMVAQELGNPRILGKEKHIERIEEIKKGAE